MSMLSKKTEGLRRRSEVSLSNILTIKSHSVNVLFSLLPEIYYVANSPLPKIAKHFQSYYRYKKLSLCWQTSATRFEVRSPNITIRYVKYVFLLVFYIKFVPKTYHFWDIRLQKSRDLENRVRGPSRSLQMSTFDRAHIDLLLTFSEVREPGEGAQQVHVPPQLWLKGQCPQYWCSAIGCCPYLLVQFSVSGAQSSQMFRCVTCEGAVVTVRL